MKAPLQNDSSKRPNTALKIRVKNRELASSGHPQAEKSAWLMLGRPLKRKGLLALSLMVGMTFPGAARAQSLSDKASPPSPGDPAAGADSQQSPELKKTDLFSPVSWKYGDWRGFFTFTAQLRYDDNITCLSHNTLSDLIGVAAPACNLEYVPAKADGNTLLHLDYTPQFLGYRQHSEFNTINQQANFNADYLTGRSEFRISDALVITTDPAVEQAQWGKTTDDTSEFSWSYQATEKTSATVKPYQDWSQMDHGLTVWQYGVSLEAGYQLTEKFDLLGSYDVSTVHTSAGSDGLIQAWLAGFSWEITGRSRVDFRCGLQTIGLSGAGASGTETSPDMSLTWNYQLGPKTTIDCNLDYENRFSKYTANQLSKTLAGRLTAKYAWTEKISLELRGGVQSVDQTSVLASGHSGGTFNYETAGVGLAYQLNQKTELRLDYDRQQRSASQIYSQYERDIIQLQLQHRF